MSTVGKKISELENDDYVSGQEKIPVSDNGVTKFLTIEQILRSAAAKNTEHELEQQETIIENSIKINELIEKINTDVWETFTE